jgi:hypothetical protein
MQADELDALIARVRDRFTPEPAPAPTCKVCGGALTPTHMMVGVYGAPSMAFDRLACSIFEPDPENPGQLRLKPSRTINEWQPGRHWYDSQTQAPNAATVDPDVAALLNLISHVPVPALLKAAERLA